MDRLLWVDGAARDVIECPKLEPWIMRYELGDLEWAAIKPLLPNKSRGVRRVNDRRVLNGIFWVLRSGAPWRDLPVCYGPRTTCYNRFVRWRKAGVWDQIMDYFPPLMMPVQDRHVHRARLHAACIARTEANRWVAQEADRPAKFMQWSTQRAACPFGTYSRRS